nr:piggyBac transposable element-derived protein 4-like [Onthophagus taurus]
MELIEESSDPDKESDNDISKGSESGKDEYFIGKDKKTKWCKNQVVSKFSKTASKNIVKIFPGPRQCAKDVTNERSAFEKFFSDDIIENIVECTNLQIAKMRIKYNRPRRVKDTTKTEFMAFVGLLLLAGTKKQNHTHFLELWTKDGTGSEIFRAFMSYDRFLFLLAALRFDDKNTRSDRKLTDKLAAIRVTLDRFEENCTNNYCLGEEVTIDEMLVPFRGRCSFLQYIPSKPAKYGLKVFVLCEAQTFYVTNLEVYCGNQPKGPYNQSNKPADIVHRLLQNWKGKNRNLTCDNWYASYKLANDLLKDKVTMVGTIRKNIRELPLEFLPSKEREVGSSLFGFQKEITIVSYVPKKNKAVCLISTMHNNSEVDPDTRKPNIILDYNCHKGGVDTIDKMCDTYSVSRRTQRWPMVIFFQLINIAGINSQILYNAANIANPQKYRRIFLKELSISLMRPCLSERAEIQSLPLDVKLFLKRYKAVVEEHEGEEPPVKMRGRCYCYGRRKNRVTTISCDTCSRMVCKEH